MADVNYQSPMQLMELLGLRGWENAQPRVYWGLRRPDGLPLDWYAPNAGLGGAGAGSWGGGYQGGYGNVTGGGGGFNSAGVFSAPLSAGPSAARAFGAPDVGGAGASEPGAFSGDGVGLNAQSGSFGDFLGSLATGPVTGLLGVLGQAAYNGITGQPGKPITGTMPFSLASLLGLGSGEQGTAAGTNTSDLGNVGVNAAQGNYGGAALDAVGSLGAYDGGGAGAGSNSDPGPSPGDPTGGEGPANLYKGGPVTLDKLAGPNPPGPDDGVAYLDVGEHVLTAEEVRKMGGHGAVMKLRDLIRRS